MIFLLFITSSELLAYDVERKEYVSISDNTYSKYDGNTDIKNFCACIANQFNEESFADLAATVTIVNCGANLLYVDKLYNVLEGCKEKNVLNVERILSVVAFSKGIKKEQQLCFQVFGQYYLVESNANSEISAKDIDKPQAETIELKAEDFALVYRFVADGQCGEELEKVKQQLSEKEQAWEQKEIDWKSKFDSQQAKIDELEEENKGYKDKEREELEKQREIEEEKKKLKVGSVITFGKWHDENVEWQILDIKDGKALLLSKYGLDSQPYNCGGWVGDEWQRSTLRTWLNTTFYEECFSKEEKESVLKTDIFEYSWKDWYEALEKFVELYGKEEGPLLKKFAYENHGERICCDRIFLLHKYELEFYLENDYERCCKLSDYTIKKGVSDRINDGYGTWWLRACEVNSKLEPCIVKSDGTIPYGGSDGTNKVVRPAMWIDLDKYYKLRSNSDRNNDVGGVVVTKTFTV